MPSNPREALSWPRRHIPLAAVGISGRGEGEEAVSEEPAVAVLVDEVAVLLLDATEPDDQKKHDRVVPVPPSLGELIRRRPNWNGSQWLFPTPGGQLWRERNFYRDVWSPARIGTGMNPTPHEFRHSYVSHLRALGIDDADLVRVAGHNVETMISRYTHPLEQSHERIRGVIG